MFFLFFLTILLPTILSQENIAYDYLNHGSDWTGTCKDGTRQSPIDLISNIAKNSTKFSYFQPLYAPSFAFVSHLNTSLLLEGSFGSLFTISADLIAKSLNLNADQVRFRAPSEHTFGGARYPLEVQIHHQVRKKRKQDVEGLILFFITKLKKYLPAHQVDQNTQSNKNQ